jgi:hypothetical protein
MFFFGGVIPKNSAVAADLWVYNITNPPLLHVAPEIAPALPPTVAPSTNAPTSSPAAIFVAAPLVAPAIQLPPTPISEEQPPTGCLGEAPVSFICLNGIWTFQAGASFTPGSVNGTVQINNVTINLNFVDNSTLFVFGNVSVGSTTIVVSLTPQQIERIKSGLPLTTAIITSTGDISTNGGITIQTNTPGINSRVVVSVDPTTGRRSLVLIFDFAESTSSNSSGSIVPIAAGVGCTSFLWLHTELGRFWRSQFLAALAIVVIAIVIAIVLRKTKLKYVGADIPSSRARPQVDDK